MEYGPVDFVADIKTICEHNCDDCNRCLGDIRDICNAGYGKDALRYITPSTVSMVRAIADTIRSMKSIPNLNSVASADEHTIKCGRPSAKEFIEFALSHVHRDSIPEGAELVQCDSLGEDPWEFLIGTSGDVVSNALLLDRYYKFYEKKGWTLEAYQIATEHWVELNRRACDDEGLLDAFLDTDVTVHYNYVSWCPDTGLISVISRPWRIGEAVFYVAGGRASHVGFVCGYIDDEPLIVEARGIRFGVVVTRLTERPWTHRGLITKRLNYEDDSQNKPEGEWIPDKYDPEFKFECSCCHWTGEHPYKYCPECGSKMMEKADEQ